MGALGICRFWAVELLAWVGRVEETRKQFEDLLDYANGVELFAEEIDRRGAVPSFIHTEAYQPSVQLVNAQHTVSKKEEQADKRSQ